MHSGDLCLVSSGTSRFLSARADNFLSDSRPLQIRLAKDSKNAPQLATQETTVLIQYHKTENAPAAEHLFYLFDGRPLCRCANSGILQLVSVDHLSVTPVVCL